MHGHFIGGLGDEVGEEAVDEGIHEHQQGQLDQREQLHEHPSAAPDRRNTIAAQRRETGILQQQAGRPQRLCHAESRGAARPRQAERPEERERLPRLDDHHHGLRAHVQPRHGVRPADE